MTSTLTSSTSDGLGHLIHDAARLMRKRFEDKASHFGLSAAQWRLLVRVFKEEGIAQARLAELLEVEPISVSRLLDRMEEAGWIERRPDATDRRVRQVFLTERSRPIFGGIRELAAEVYEQALTGLTDDERRTTLRALKTICLNLSDSDPTTKPAAPSTSEKAA